jgi:hypothetical protein
MPKPNRRAAIAAEIARRERESGVPLDRHVYAFRPHHSDEGGPRYFVPVRCSQNLRESEANESRYDRGLLGRLIERAVSGEEPIELMPDPSDCFVPDAPPADYCAFGVLHDRLMIFSARAAAALRELLEPSCQPVPVTCPGHELVGYQLRAVEDVLDTAKSDGWWDDYKLRQRASDIKSYTFFTERLGRATIFTLPQHGQTLVLQPFVDIVRGREFTGFRFRKVWPRSTVAQWE